MATQLPFDQALLRFQSNDVRFTTFINGSNTDVYITSDNVYVPSIQHFLKDKSLEIDRNLNSTVVNTINRIISTIPLTGNPGPIGLTGNTGPQGQIGTPGPIGPIGTQGPIGPSGISSINDLKVIPHDQDYTSTLIDGNTFWYHSNTDLTPRT